MKEQKEKISELMDELKLMGINIRNDWSDFDGRYLLKALDIWLMKLGKVTGIEYKPYYDNPERFKDLFNQNVAMRFANDKK